jgi:hypothetical protein
MTKFALAIVALCLLAGLLAMVGGCVPELAGDTTTTDEASSGDLTPLRKTSLPTSDSTTPMAETAVALEAADRLAELHLVGGFAGFCDHLVVYVDGSASVFNECSGQQTDFQVDSEAFDQLMAMAVKFGPFFYRNEDNPDSPDSMLTDLTLYGQGPAANQPDQEQRDALLRLMFAILNQGTL